jgi:hypothetical protein
MNTFLDGQRIPVKGESFILANRRNIKSFKLVRVDGGHLKTMLVTTIGSTVVATPFETNSCARNFLSSPVFNGIPLSITADSAYHGGKNGR